MRTDSKNPTPRTLELVQLVETMTVAHRRPPTFQELAAEMSVSVPRIQALIARAKSCGLVDLEPHRPRTIRVLGQPKAIRRQRAGCA